MSTPHLKTYYRRGATILTPEQIEEIRKSKNKVPKYVLVRNFHINENRVEDIWKNSERSQQNGDHSLSNTVDRFPDSSHLLNIGMDENVMQVNSIVTSDKQTKKTSRKKKDNSSVELSKGGDLSESKTIHHSILNNQSTSSVPENEVQARMSHLRKYAKELQAES
ncbi:7930_t:CDS:1 [Entrophospora sp. SA101]|nr:7930_t:CDS:1 [Entrophospora sp. SA101]CAJ0837937.1 11763_t:CDS:1 [Entrophospora sp. SA101]